MTTEQVREKLLARGWRQGACIGVSTVLEALQACGLSHKRTELEELSGSGESAGYLVAMISSCDVVYGDLEELPRVEFQLCKPKSISGQNSKHSNPRYMIIRLQDKKHVAHMRDSISLQKEMLLDLSPDFMLEAGAVNAMVRWKASLYNRLTLPETLVKRIAGCLRNRPFEAFLKRYHERLEGIFFEISSLEELGDDDYDLGIMAILKNMDTSPAETLEIREQLDSVLVAPIREVDGVNLLNDTEYEAQGLDLIMAKQDVTFDLLERFRKYHLDHFSLEPEFNERLNDLD